MQLHCKECLSTLLPKQADGPGKFINCSTFLVLKTNIYCFLKSILFSASIFTALLRLYIRIANMIKAEKALLVQLATVQQHYVLLQAKHLFQASRKNQQPEAHFHEVINKQIVPSLAKNEMSHACMTGKVFRKLTLYRRHYRPLEMWIYVNVLRLLRCHWRGSHHYSRCFYLRGHM